MLPNREQVRQLYIDGGFADYIGEKYGLEKNCALTGAHKKGMPETTRPHDSADVRSPPIIGSTAHINAMVPAKLRVHYEIADGTEGAFEQNATLCAAIIRDFLRGWPDESESGMQPGS